MCIDSLQLSPLPSKSMREQKQTSSDKIQIRKYDMTRVNDMTKLSENSTADF